MKGKLITVLCLSSLYRVQNLWIRSGFGGERVVEREERDREKSTGRQTYTYKGKDRDIQTDAQRKIQRQKQRQIQRDTRRERPERRGVNPHKHGHIASFVCLFVFAVVSLFVVDVVVSCGFFFFLRMIQKRRREGKEKKKKPYLTTH